MPVKDDTPDAGSSLSSAVERSLEDFIARANTTLPSPTEEAQAALKDRKRSKKDPSLVVLGPQAPLAEVTEIVQRLPAADLAPKKSRAPLAAALAFIAGAVAVFIATRFISGTPEPVAPTPQPVVEAAPKPVVVPMSAPDPVPAPVPVPDPAPPAPAPELAPAPSPPRRPTRVATRKPPPTPRATTPSDAPAPEKRKPAPTGLVDPFAN